MNRNASLVAALAVAMASAAGLAARAEDLKLVGLQGQTDAVTPAQLAAMPHVRLTVTVEGKTTTYRGVPLSSLLALVGAPLGKALHGAELRDMVLVTAADGYAAALALAEADPMERNEQILLADR